MKRGFTLMELLVVCAIIGLMTTVVLANTHNLGINAKIKAAQSLIIDTTKDTLNKSVAVKQFSAGVFPSYGVDLDTASPQQIVIYADCIADDNADGTINDRDTFNYSSGGSSCGGAGTLVQKVLFDSATKITAIRATYPVGGTEQTFTESKADILFLRPEPTIWITVPSAITSTNLDGLIPVGKIEIDVSDLSNKYTQTVVVYSSGEFSDK